MRIYLLAVTAMIAAGCATTPKYDSQLQPWVGRSQGELFGEWGAPSNVITNDQGNTVLVYHKERAEKKGGMSMNVGGSFPGGNQPIGASKGSKTIIHYCDTSFVLDASNRITSYSYEGDDCE